MRTSDVLKTAQEKVDCALFAYSHDKRTDSELHERLIDDLTKETIKFLELREKVFRGNQWERLADAASSMLVG